ncbi:MAG: RNA 2',3'-cyclic phosphodiesterase [Candidatus Aminicenantaceae bacterium]
MRAFIAVELSEAVKNALLSFLREVKLFDAPVRWVRPEGIHLTLKFLGEISASRVAEVSSILDDVTARHAAFSLEFVGTGTFPAKPQVPRIIWSGISQSRPLESLHFDLEEGLEAIEIPRERRRFHPHLTLGRIKSPRNLEAALKFVCSQERTAFGSMSVHSVDLYKSTLKPEGAEYSRIHSASLS